MEHRIGVSSVDRAGNESEKEITFKTSSNIESTIANATHYWELGILRDEKELKFILNKLDEIAKKIGDLNKKERGELKDKPKTTITENFQEQIQRKIDWLASYISDLPEEKISSSARNLLVDNLKNMEY